MPIKPDKLPSLTNSYRPISLLSIIMKLFEQVIEKRLRKHLGMGHKNGHLIITHPQITILANKQKDKERKQKTTKRKRKKESL